MALTKTPIELSSTPSIVDGGNATAITIDSSENVGIGASPATQLFVKSASNAANVFAIESADASQRLQFGVNTSNGGSYIFEQKVQALRFGTSDTERMIIDSSGNVGIGTSTITNPYSQTPFTDVNINGTWGGAISFQLGGVTKGWVGQRSSGNEDMVIGATAGQELLFYENNVEAMRLSGGNLLVGNTGLASNKMSIYNSGADALRIALADNAASTVSLIAGYSDSTTTAYGTLRLNIVANGNVTNSNNSYGGISDEKLKENITDATPKLDSLNQVRIVNYNLISDPENKQLGVIAQELEQIFPNMVDEFPDKDNDGNDLGTTTKSVKYSVFVPMLIKGIQEQQAIIESQSSAITDLTTRLTALENT